MKFHEFTFSLFLPMFAFFQSPAFGQKPVTIDWNSFTKISEDAQLTQLEGCEASYLLVHQDKWCSEFANMLDPVLVKRKERWIKKLLLVAKSPADKKRMEVLLAANYNSDLKNVPKALTYLDHLELLKGNFNGLLYLEARFSKGYYYMLISDYSKASKEFYETLEEKGLSLEHRGLILYDLAVIHSINEHYELSCEHAYMALKYVSGEDRIHAISLLVSNLRELNETKEADRVLKQLERYGIDQLSDASKGLYFQQLGSRAWKKEELYEALKNYRLSCSYFQKTGDTRMQIYLFNHIGEIYFQLSDDTRARNNYLTCLQLLDIYSGLTERKEVLYNLYRVEKRTGRLRQALKYLEEFQLVSNKIFSLAKEKEILLLDKKFKNKLLKTENLLLEKKNLSLNLKNKLSQQEVSSKRATVIMLSVICALALVLIGTLMYASLIFRKETKVKFRLLEEKKNSALISAELNGQQFERARVSRELHDNIGNQLLVLSLAVEETHKNRLLSLYQEVRTLSHDWGVNTQQVSSDLKTLIQDVFSMFHGRLRTRVSFRYYPESKPVELGHEKAIHLFRILQEIFTNQLKHSNANNIEIDCTVFDTEAQLMVVDNGVGFDAEAKMKLNGSGLDNINHRIQLMDGTLFIDSKTGKGTTHILNFPV